MNFLLGAGGGFLIAVLWMDLMFDVLVFSRTRSREEAVDEIAAYYRRVTTTASPMHRLIAVVMASMVIALAWNIVRAPGSRWIDIGSIVLCGVPIALAQARIFPNAARLGSRAGDIGTRHRLAREICFAHLACLAAMSAFVALRWLAG